MSKQDVKNIRSAYEKMLEDGTANKKVDMSMLIEPDVASIEGLGEQVEKPVQEQKQEQEVEVVDDYTDYTEHDNYIEKRINSLRSKMNEKKGNVKSKKTGGALREIASLKKRVEKLEEALMLVMETHENLLG